MIRKFTACHRSTGQVLFSGTSFEPMELENGTQYVILDVTYEGGWVDEGVHHLPDPQPSPHHKFNWTTKQWEDSRTAESEWALVRTRRNLLLKSTDWTQLSDVPISNKAAWATYRQALRDVTNQTDPFNITWPEAPQ